MSGQMVVVLGAVFGTFLTAGGSWLVARIGAKTTAEASAMSSVLQWAEQTQSRLTEVEGTVEEVRAELRTTQNLFRGAVTFIDRIGIYFAGGMRGPVPRPSAQLHEYIDMSLWENGEENHG